MGQRFGKGWIIGSAAAGLVLLVGFGTKLILLDSFRDLEREDTARNVERVQSAITETLEHLSITAGDYAGWDDSYRFARDRNRSYVTANLTDATLAKLRLNLVLFLDPAGRLFHAKQFDLKKGKETPLHPDLLAHFPADSPLLVHEDKSSVHSGILLLPDGPTLIVSRPILTSNYEGPIRGALLMGRHLDELEVARLARNAHLDLRFTPFDAAHPPAETLGMLEALTGATPIVVRPRDRSTVSGYTLLKDMQGKPILLLQVDLPRRIYQEGLHTITYFLVLFLLAASGFATVSTLLVRKLGTSRRQGEESEQRYQAVIEQATEGIVLVEPETLHIREGNRAFQDLVGYDAATLNGLSLSDLAPPDSGGIAEEIRRAQRERREIRLVHQDGSLVDTEVSASRIPSAGQEVSCLVFHDITERKQFEEQLMRQSSFDSLTDLPNRSLLHDRLHQALAYAKRKDSSLAVLLLDLDHFKVINDTLGHRVGDLLLVAVADRLRGLIRASDTIARLGGDEFVIAVSGFQETTEVIAVARHILDLFAVPFTLADRELFVTATIGIAMPPFDGDNVDHLLRNADTAMYHGKGLGRNTYQFFAAEMNRKANERLVLEMGLRRALEREEFVLHYQPQVDLATGAITGMEALLRWADPEAGIVEPAVFIGLAEETGLILPIGDWVLRTACAQSRRWQSDGLPPLRIAVNLSGRQARQPGLVESIRGILAETELNPQCLELELTESVLLDNVADITEKLHALRELGVRIAIDDFGTGYSSLNYLKQLPVDSVKIDRTFLDDIITERDGSPIVSAIIALAHSLHLTVIAEGVETSQQFSFLRENRCEEMQGFYFSKPLPADVMTGILRLDGTPGQPNPFTGVQYGR